MIGMIPYFICFVLLAAAFVLLPRKHTTKRVAVALLVLSFLGELFICNFHSFHLLGGGYETNSIDLTAETVTVSGGETDAPLTTKKGGTVTITVTGLKQPVGTARIRLAFSENAPSATVKIAAKDVTQAAAWRSGVADGTVVQGDTRSEYVVLDLSGDVSELRFAVSAPKDATVTVEGVTLNEKVPLRFSALRLVLFVLGCMAVYALVAFPSMKKTFGESPATLKRTAAVLTAVLVVAAILMTWASMYDQNGAISTGFANQRGNQITQEIVDAFRAGQVHLLDEPSEELLAMENPYDWSARREQGVSAKWDHLLFEGKYYSYYGIAPVLLLFLPYNLVTGYYFPTAEAILLFGGLGIIFLTLLFLEFAKLFGKRIPNSMLISTLVILQMSSGVWYNFVYDNFYEIAQSSGFLFTCAGFFFLLKSRIIGEGRINHLHLTLATVCLSWAVLCRPTLALYCIVACIFLVFGYFKRRDEVKALPPPRRHDRQAGHGPRYGQVSPGRADPLRADRRDPGDLQRRPLWQPLGLRHSVFSDHQRFHAVAVPHRFRHDRPVQLPVRLPENPARVPLRGLQFLHSVHQWLLLYRQPQRHRASLAVASLPGLSRRGSRLEGPHQKGADPSPLPPGSHLYHRPAGHHLLHLGERLRRALLL
ncbi:MAG: hypothetical protein J6K29_07070 [Clostridia bacterium]|nr:hypothetical protein [Clostridia bacterium]